MFLYVLKLTTVIPFSPAEQVIVPRAHKTDKRLTKHVE